MDRFYESKLKQQLNIPEGISLMSIIIRLSEKANGEFQNTVPTHNKHIFVRPKKMCLFWEMCSFWKMCLFWKNVIILRSEGLF